MFYENMKDVRILVASSRELERERNHLAFLVLAKEDEFAARGFRVRLAKWEYVDPKMTAERSEDRYLEVSLAENVHDTWAKGRMDDGWTYGPVLDDAKKQHPCLVPVRPSRIGKTTTATRRF